jgi:hypothetical protein
MLLKYQNDEAGATLVFDDNGKAAYAYLIVNKEVVSDVWLYNVGEPPQKQEWLDRKKLPFANPYCFVFEETFEPINDPDEIGVSWVVGSDGLRQVSVSLRGQEHVILRPGTKPGWCRLAAKTSPIAKPLNEAK